MPVILSTSSSSDHEAFRQVDILRKNNMRKRKVKKSSTNAGICVFKSLGKIDLTKVFGAIVETIVVNDFTALYVSQNTPITRTVQNSDDLISRMRDYENQLESLRKRCVEQCDLDLLTMLSTYCWTLQKIGDSNILAKMKKQLHNIHKYNLRHPNIIIVGINIFLCDVFMGYKQYTEVLKCLQLSLQCIQDVAPCITTSMVYNRCAELYQAFAIFHPESRSKYFRQAYDMYDLCRQHLHIACENNPNIANHTVINLVTLNMMSIKLQQPNRVILRYVPSKYECGSVSNISLEDMIQVDNLQNSIQGHISSHVLCVFIYFLVLQQRKVEILKSKQKYKRAEVVCNKAIEMISNNITSVTDPAALDYLQNMKDELTVTQQEMNRFVKENKNNLVHNSSDTTDTDDKQGLQTSDFTPENSTDDNDEGTGESELLLQVHSDDANGKERIESGEFTSGNDMEDNQEAIEKFDLSLQVQNSDANDNPGLESIEFTEDDMNDTQDFNGKNQSDLSLHIQNGYTDGFTGPLKVPETIVNNRKHNQQNSTDEEKDRGLSNVSDLSEPCLSCESEDSDWKL